MKHLTRRGWLVLVILPGLAAIYYVATHVHWTDTGYCWGSFDHCYQYEDERK